MITERTGNTVRRTYVSLTEFADYAETQLHHVRTRMGSSWSFGESGKTNADALSMARLGWLAKLDQTLEVAEDAITEIEREMDLPKWEPLYGFSGCAVDMGAYLNGEPECMIEYPVTPMPSTGRVVTICTSISASSAVSAESLIKRGMMIAALAMLLERLGYNTEIWADLSARGGGAVLHERVLVKSANDTIDGARILYAIANPSMLRVLGFAVMHGLDYDIARKLGVGSSYGSPSTPEADLPEGTIYLSEMYSAYDYDAKAELVGHLKSLGIIE